MTDSVNQTLPTRVSVTRIDTQRALLTVSQLDDVMAVCEQLANAVDDLIAGGRLFGAGCARHAFVSLVTPDYRWGLVAWLRSLRKVSQKPILLIVFQEIKIPVGIEGVHQILMPKLLNESYIYSRSEYRNVLSKFWIFALTPLERVFFTDVDCLFLEPVDELFERGEQFLVCPDYVETRHPRQFNAGVMVFSPTSELRDHVFSMAQGIASSGGGDQEPLNVMLGDRVTFIDEKFNLLRHFYYFSGRKNFSDVAIVHYIQKKPWELHYRETPDAFLVELDDLWTSFLTYNELLQLVEEWRRSVFHISERACIEGARADWLSNLNTRIQRLEQMGSDRRQKFLIVGSLAAAAIFGSVITAVIFLTRT